MKEAVKSENRQHELAALRLLKAHGGSSGEVAAELLLELDGGTLLRHEGSALPTGEDGFVQSCRVHVLKSLGTRPLPAGLPLKPPPLFRTGASSCKNTSTGVQGCLDEVPKPKSQWRQDEVSMPLSKRLLPAKWVGAFASKKALAWRQPRTVQAFTDLASTQEALPHTEALSMSMSSRRSRARGKAPGGAPRTVWGPKSETRWMPSPRCNQ